MTNKFLLGKIYKLFNENECYIGCTTNTLEKTLSNLKSKYKQYQNGKYHNVSYFKILEGGKFNMELIESYPCNTKRELSLRHGYWIKSIDSVNDRVQGRTRKEHRAENRELYRERNRKYEEKRKMIRREIKEKKQEQEQRQATIEENKKQKQAMNEQKREQEQRQRKKLKEQKKYQREQKREQQKREFEEMEQIEQEIKDMYRSNRRILCECGAKYYDKETHEKSRQHNDYIAIQSSQVFLRSMYC